MPQPRVVTFMTSVNKVRDYPISTTHAAGNLTVNARKQCSDNPDKLQFKREEYEVKRKIKVSYLHGICENTTHGSLNCVVYCRI